MSVELASASDIATFIRPGDHIIWGEGCGEPQTLAEAVVAQRHALGPLNVFLGMAFSDTVRPEHCDMLRVSSYGTLGTTRRLAAAGALDILPCHVSRLTQAIETRELPCDVALLQLSPPGANGKPSPGPINDYIRSAVARARVVIAEINDQVPWTYGPEFPGLERITATLRTSRPLVATESKSPSPIDIAIAAHAASVIPDGSTLQVGIGSTIDAVLRNLADRRDLGIHSGAIGDGVLDLIERGVITNARKTIDKGITVTGSLIGSRRLLDFANRNPKIEIHPFDYTHNGAVLLSLTNLVAINSAIEADITGQINAEVTGGQYLGAVGGQVDFMHAATRSRNGCSIIAMPSTAAGGKTSRIRMSVETVTSARSEVDFVVTEYGFADLRAQSFRERMRRMIAIAHPDFREDLERQAHDRLARGF